MLGVAWPPAFAGANSSGPQAVRPPRRRELVRSPKVGVRAL